MPCCRRWADRRRSTSPSNFPTAACWKNTTSHLIGANVTAIKKAEDRLVFKDAMQKIGLEVPKSALVNNIKDGLEFAGKIGFPVIIRPSFTLGGSGGGIAL